MGDGKMGVIDPGYGRLGQSEADKAALAEQSRQQAAYARQQEAKRKHDAAMPSKDNQATVRNLLSAGLEAFSAYRSRGLDAAGQVQLVATVMATAPADLPLKVRGSIEETLAERGATALATGDFGKVREQVRTDVLRIASEMPDFPEPEVISDDEAVARAVANIPRSGA